MKLTLALIAVAAAASNTACTKHSNTACAGRNELFSERGFTRQTCEAKAHTYGNMVSFEFHTEAHRQSGRCQISSSCTKALSRRYNNIDLHDCTTPAPTPVPTATPTAAPTPKPEELKLELDLNMNRAQFDAAAQAALKVQIAAQLGVVAGNVEIRILQNGAATRRRLAAAGFRILVIIKVQKEKVAAAIKAVEAPKFAAVTMAKVTEIIPSAGAGICASCTYDGMKISVTHYRTATEKTHRCYHKGGACSCMCI